MNLTYSTAEFFYDNSFDDYPNTDKYMFKYELLKYELVKYFREYGLSYSNATYAHVLNAAHYHHFKVIKQDYKSEIITDGSIKRWIIIQLCWVDDGGVNFYKFLDFDQEILMTYQFLSSLRIHFPQH